jgi:hypothetical protein
MGTFNILNGKFEANLYQRGKEFILLHGPNVLFFPIALQNYS